MKPTMKASAPKTTILDPFMRGFCLLSLPKYVPAVKRIVRANITEIHEATVLSKICRVARSIGISIMLQHMSGVKKLKNAMIMAYDL